jgi:hypothetical protein
MKLIKRITVFNARSQLPKHFQLYSISRIPNRRCSSNVRTIQISNTYKAQRKGIRERGTQQVQNQHVGT